MLNPGTIGSKRQSWEKYNPRDVLRDAILTNPRGSEAEIRDVVWETIRNEKRYLEPIFDYWFTNNYRHFYADEIGKHSVAIYERKIGARNGNGHNNISKEVEQRKNELKTLLLDHVLSNGKALREATFRDCRQEGGWLIEVAKQGRANEVVGKKLTEKNLMALRLRAMKSG